jgi:hypothetical protein
MSYSGGRSAGGGAGLDEEDVPAEDSELKRQDNQRRRLRTRWPSRGAGAAALFVSQPRALRLIS